MIRKARSGAISKRKAAKEIGVSEWTVRDRMKKDTPVQKEHMSLPYESERSSKIMLEIKAKWDYATTRDEVTDLVQSYVNENKPKDSYRIGATYSGRDPIISKVIKFTENGWPTHSLAKSNLAASTIFS